ncbi:GNAT family N-acetyltransferase [Marinomonas sp. C2222]|uniref:GNAT family N-acetyltransferase n=1 Tax=Marinomonas sargassi TaxID=2984494 RepID=A0ABT2YW62_9GAMM|nr:GNAT family N-acetyltransferase [Marinomonas sargassi]MCV2404093.1 GNAT family N-acetyltransferase [Marinomonas sargassi]
MSFSFVIRPAQESDLPALIELDLSSNPYPWGESHIADALRTRKSWLVESVQEGQKSILAWLTASHCFDQSELELIVVDEKARRQGLARKLINTWQQDAQESDVKELLLEVRESNEGAIALYISMGFEQVGYRKNYYKLQQGREAACLFTLKI